MPLRIFQYRPSAACLKAIQKTLLAGLILFVQACSFIYSDDTYSAQQLRVTGIAPDSAAQALITPYKSTLDAEMNAVVGEIAVDMRREKPESTLGNFICDVVVAQSQKVYQPTIDFGVYNYGGIRQEFLNKGPVTKGKIYELLPFENFGAVVKMDGAGVWALAQKIVDEGGWPVSSCIKIVVRENKVAELFIQGAPVDNTKTYHVVMNDYMANGGDKMPFIKPENIQVLGVTIRDMMLTHLQELSASGKQASAAKEGRIVYAD